MKDGSVVTIDSSIIISVIQDRTQLLVGTGRSMLSYKFEIGETVFLLASLSCQDRRLDCDLPRYQDA